MYRIMLQKYIASFIAFYYFCYKHEPSEGGM